jgi:hypothetical protein
MKKSLVRVPHTSVENAILIIRNERVILDTDLAGVYGVENRALIQSVKRNIRRFPPDFLFQLTKSEFDSLRSQIVISKGRGGRRSLPYAFTEHGAIMAANLLNSERAIEASVEVVRAFVRLRTMVLTNAELAKRLDGLEKRYDEHFKIVFTAIRQLMVPPKAMRKPIGFHVKPLKK